MLTNNLLKSNSLWYKQILVKIKNRNISVKNYLLAIIY